MSKDLIEVINTVINTIERQASRIAVREQVNGQFGNFYLTELPAELAIRHVCNILRTRIRNEASQ